jgi:succinate-acetate transporter protein
MPNEAMANNSTRIYLQPIAAPSILGLYSLAAATFMVAAYWAHWYGTAQTPLLVFPFVALFGGLAQFLAGMWAFKARDGVATVLHAMWGSFWIAYGVLSLMFLRGDVAQPAGVLFPAFGFWFIVLAAITWILTFAAGSETKALVSVLATLAIGSTLCAIAFLAGIEDLLEIAGYVLIASSFCAWYTASAMLLEETYGREVLSLGKSRRMKGAAPVISGEGEAGVIRGQA